MRISIFGLGYVGAVCAGCLSARGHEVIGVDISANKIDLINNGKSPIVEPGLEELLQQGLRQGRLRGTTDVFGGPLPSGCLSAPGEFLTQFPRLTQALSDAMVHALKWLQTAGPSDIIKAVPERYFQGDRSLYLAASEGIYRSLPNGGFLDVNPAMARLLGYDSPRQLLDELSRDTDHLYADPGQAEALRVQLLSGGRLERQRARVRRRDGRDSIRVMLMPSRANGSSSRNSAPGASVWAAETSSVVLSWPLGGNDLRPITRNRVVLSALSWMLRSTTGTP